MFQCKNDIHHFTETKQIYIKSLSIVYNIDVKLQNTEKSKILKEVNVNSYGVQFSLFFIHFIQVYIAITKVTTIHMYLGIFQITS